MPPFDKHQLTGLDQVHSRPRDAALGCGLYLAPRGEVGEGSVTERLTFFVTPYERQQRVDAGGGDASEGEDIEVLEPTLDEALAMVARGQICDGKTIMLLLQHAKLSGLVD